MSISFLIVVAPVAFRQSGFVGFVLVAGAASAAWLRLAVQPAKVALAFPALIAIALVLRSAMLLFSPELSGDVWRYLWDGTVSLEGINPYALAPNDPALAGLREPWHSQINHPEIRTVYPPYAQALFLVAAAGGSLLWWRLILIGAEVLLIRGLYQLDPRAAVLWGLCPLVVWEGVWSAHVDLVAAGMLLATLALVSRPVLAGAALAIASGIKVIPAIVLPAFLLRGRGPRALIASFLIVTLTAMLPFLRGPFMPGFGDYASRWSFNGVVYTPLVALIDLLGFDGLLRNVWTAVKDPLALESISSTVYRHLHPDFLARIILGVMLVAGLILIVRRTEDLASAAADSLGLLLLLSPTVHPWYWLPVVVVALVARRTLWLILASASPLSYLLYAGASPSSVLLLTYAIPATLLSLSRQSRS